ncbi:MAG: hypothetical protein RLN62_02545 [Rickettsiales bacterium]
MADGGGGSHAAKRSERDEVPAPNRRLDALARVITGGDVCSAVALHKKTLYISNNNSTKNPSWRSTRKLLHTILTTEGDKKVALEEGKFDEEIAEVIRESITAYTSRTDSAKLRIRPKRGEKPEDTAAREAAKREETKEGYRQRLKRDLAKLIDSLTVDEEGKKLQDEITSALRNKISEDPDRDAPAASGGGIAGEGDSAIIFLKSEEKGKHAEMVIMDTIIDRIENEREEAKTEGREIPTLSKVYVGISKLCCWQCKCAIEVANEVYKTKDGLGIFETAGSSNTDFERDRWVKPHFLGIEGLEEEFNEKFVRKKPPQSRTRAKSSTSPPTSTSESAVDKGEAIAATLTTESEVGDSSRPKSPSGSGSSRAKPSRAITP